MLSRLRRRDEGLALILVLGTVAVLTLLVLLALEVGVRGMQRARQDQSHLAAMPAAQAGVEDYLHRLNLDNNYFTRENDDTANPAFSRWLDVPGAANDGEFRYRVLSTAEDTLNTGSIRLQASGRVRDRVRTVEVTLRKRGFLDYLYFTDFETIDPSLYPQLLRVSDVSLQTGECDRHFPDRGSVRWPVDLNEDGTPDDTYTFPCQDIFFRSEDRLQGPVGSNDAFLIQGSPTFTDTVTTGWTDPENKSGGRYFRAEGWNYTGVSPTFGKGGLQPGIRYDMPPGNDQIRPLADRALGGSGCLYTGPTRIRLLPSGQMEVTSPYTKSAGTGCGSGFADWQKRDDDDDEGDDDGENDIKDAKKVNVALPSNGVVFVQPIPNDPADPNYDPVASGDAPCPPLPLLHVDGKFPDDKEWFPTPYSCRSGDAWVEGTLQGRLTITAENDIYLTGDLRYTNGRDRHNLLGLIANNNVLVYHPVEYKREGSSWVWKEGPGANRDVTIEAAILALNHGFAVQNYDRGEALGTLTVNGAIAQKFRGAVGMMTAAGKPKTGYAKDYRYDRRLQYLQPPFFLTPAVTSWSVRSFSEQRPASYSD